MRFVIASLFAVLAFAAAADAAAFPFALDEEPGNGEPRGLTDLEPTAIEEQLRFKRATCDLLSFQSKWISINDSACAAHCLAKRYKGGHCSNGICRCRK